MSPSRGLCAVVMSYLCAIPLTATCAEITVILLNEENNRLGRGDAVVTIHSKEPEWSRCVPFWPRQAEYRTTFPSVDAITVRVKTNRENCYLDLAGLHGHVNHKLVLRVDQLSPMGGMYGASLEDFPMEYSELLDDLDHIYPNGVPGDMTNIREFLRESVQSKLNALGADLDPDERNAFNELQQRIARHLR